MCTTLKVWWGWARVLGSVCHKSKFIPKVFSMTVETERAKNLFKKSSKKRHYTLNLVLKALTVYSMFPPALIMQYTNLNVGFLMHFSNYKLIKIGTFFLKLKGRKGHLAPRTRQKKMQAHSKRQKISLAPC